MLSILNIAICEDEIEEEKKLTVLLDESNIPNTYDVFTTGDALLSSFEIGKYDLLLMDIYMKNSITGVNAIEEIRKLDETIPVAFITTSKDHALEGWRLAAINYIEKPVSKKQIDETLHLAKLKKDDAPSLFIQKNGDIERIPFSQIVYIEQQMHKIFIQLKNSEHIETYGKLSEIVSQLPEKQFVTPHKSFAVNLEFVRYLDTELRCFVTIHNVNVPIRRELVAKSKKALENYLYERTRRLTK